MGNKMGGVQVIIADNDWSSFANLRLRRKKARGVEWPFLSPSLVAAILLCIWKPTLPPLIGNEYLGP